MQFFKKLFFHLNIIENDIDWSGCVSTHFNRIGFENILWDKEQRPNSFPIEADIFTKIPPEE